MGKRIFIFGMAILILGAAAVQAADPADERAEGHESIVILGDDDENITITLTDGELTVTCEEDGSTSVHMVNMEQVGMLVGDALGDLDEHLALLADMQMDFHMGNDNRLNLSWDDETFEVDVNEIMVQVSEALGEGLAEFHSEDWTSVRHRDHSENELREELRELKAEMRELRRELRDLDDD